MLNSPDENTQILDSVKDFYSLQDKILTSSATATSNPTKKVEYEYTINDLYSKTVVSRPVADNCKIRAGQKVTMLSSGEVMSGWEDRTGLYSAKGANFTFTSGSVFYMVWIENNRVVFGNKDYFKIATINTYDNTITYSDEFETRLLTSEYTNVSAVAIDKDRIMIINSVSIIIISIDQSNNLIYGTPTSASMFLLLQYQMVFVNNVGEKAVVATMRYSSGTYYLTTKLIVISGDYTSSVISANSNIAIKNQMFCIQCIFLNTNVYVALYIGTDNNYYSVVCNVSGDTIVYGTPSQIMSSANFSDYPFSVIKINEGRYVLGFTRLDSGQFKKRILTIDIDEYYNVTAGNYLETGIIGWGVVNLNKSAQNQVAILHTNYENYLYDTNMYYKIYDIDVDGTITYNDQVIISVSPTIPEYTSIYQNNAMSNCSNSITSHIKDKADNIFIFSLYNIANTVNNIIGSARNTADGDLNESCEIIIDGLDDTNSGLVVNTDYYVNRDGSLTADDTDGVYFGRAVSSTKIAFQGRMKTNTLDVRTEAAVATETDETKFSHKLPIKINGVQYYVMLTQA